MANGLVQWLAQTISDHLLTNVPIEQAIKLGTLASQIEPVINSVLGDRNKVLQMLIDEMPRNSREQAMVITKLEEAQMWIEKPSKDAWREEQRTPRRSDIAARFNDP